jgi:hypothetical protein
VFTPLIRNDDGRVLVSAARGTLDGRETLLLLADMESSTLASAALMLAANRALSNAFDPAEFAPAVVEDSALRAWEQMASGETGAAPVASGVSDGRWAWALALVLLMIEALARRKSRAMVPA